MTGIPPPVQDPRARGIRPQAVEFGKVGFPGQDFPTTWWEDVAAAIGVPEELAAVAIGKVLTDNPKFDQSIGNFQRQVGFADLAVEAGLPLGIAAVLGFGAAVVNPIDPLNTAAIGKLTKIGVVADAARASAKAETVGKKILNTIKVGGRELLQFNKRSITDEIARTEKQLTNFRSMSAANPEQASNLKKLIKNSEKRLKENKKILEELPERNEILKDLQIRRGLNKDELLKTPTRADQLRSGERSLLGWVSPLSARNVPFRNIRGFEAAARPIAGGRFGAGLVETTAPIIGKAGDATRDSFNKIVRLIRGDRDLRPGVLSKRAGEATAELEEAALQHAGDEAAFKLDAENWVRKFAELGRDEQRSVIDALEDRNPAIAVPLREARQLVEDTPSAELERQIVNKVVRVPEGNLATGKKLTPGEELRFAPSTLSDVEIKTALSEWDGAKTPALRMAGTGRTNGHTYRFSQDNIVVKLNGNSKLGRMSEEELQKIFHSESMANIAGIPNYRVVVRDKEKFLVARNMPSAGSFHTSRVRATHVENLGNVAARLGLKKQLFAGATAGGDSPLPILVSPYGGVQVLDPDVFLRGANTQSQSLEYSRALIEQIVRDHTTINADVLNLPMLESIGNARRVGSGAKNYIMEPSPTDEFLELSQSGIGHVDTQFLIDRAENTGFIRSLQRGQTPDESTLRAFQKANAIDTERATIRQAQAAGRKPSFRPIVYTVSPDGRFFIVDGSARLAAAAIEGSATVPIYKRAYFGEVVANTGDYYNSYALRGFDVIDQAHTPAAAKGILDDVAKANTARKASEAAGPQIKSLQARIGEFQQERDELLRELGELSAKESADDLEMFAAETRIAEVDKEIDTLEDHLATALAADVERSLKADPEDILPRLEGILDEDYRLLDSEGNAAKLDRRSIEANTNAGTAISRDELVEAFRRLGVATQGNQRTANAQWDGLRRSLITAYGDIDGASLRLAEFATSSRNFEDFRRTLLRDMQEQGARIRDLPAGGRRTDVSNRFFQDLRNSGDRFLDNMARRGVFTTNSLTPNRARIASQSRVGTVMFPDGNDLRIVDVNKNADELAQFAKEYTKSIVDPADVHRLDRILTESSEGTRATRFEELVQGDHPRMFRAEPIPTKLQFSEAERVRLAGLNIFHIPPEGQFADLEPYQNALGLVNQDTKSMVFFRTRSGDMFVKTGALPREASVATMAEELLGEAVDAIRLQEWGYILDNKVVMNNPLGGMMHTLNNANLKKLEKQLRLSAQQFLRMGFNKNMKFDVFTPLSQEIWTDVYRRVKRDPTIGHIASNDFRLRVPKHLKHIEGTPLDIDISKPTGATRIKRTRLPKGVRELVNWAQKNLDEAMLSDAQNGFAEGWMADHFPRFMPNDTRDTLNKLYANAVDKNPRLRKAVNASERFKDRKFTDLATTEISDLFRQADINMRDILKSTDSARQAKQIEEMMRMLPGGLEFFYMDPFLATVARRLESFRIARASNVLKRLESMEDSGLLFKGTRKQFQAAQRRGANLDASRRRIDEFDRNITLMEEQHRNFGEVSDATKDSFAKLEKNLEDARNARRDEAVRLNKLVAEAVDDNLVAARIPENADSVWLSGPAARRLHTAGVLDESNMLDHPGQDLVRVRFNDAIKKITDEQNVDVYFMTPEGSELMSRFFQVQGNQQDAWSRLVRLYDRRLSEWKQLTLFPIPAFHIRNSFSDFWLMALGRVGDKDSFLESGSHLKLLSRYSKGQVTKAEAYAQMNATRITSSATGQTLNMEELWNAALGQGIAKGQFVMNDFVSSIENAGVMQDMIRISRNAGIQEASRFAGENFVTANVAVRKPREFQQTRETWQRFGIFLSEWKKTGDVRAAGMKVKEVLYDYSSLTSFERAFMRRLIPFYSWMRFNTPRMMETLLTNPVFHARSQALIRNLQFSGDGQPINKALLPEWASERGALVIGEKSDGSWMVKSLDGLLPVYDLFPILHQSPTEFGINSLSPLLKVPLEQMVNQTFFSGAPIEQVAGQRARSGTLASLGATRRATATGPLSVINLLWNEKNMNDLFRAGKQVTQALDWLTDNPNFRGDKNVTLGAMAVEMTIGRIYDIDPRFAALQAQRDDARVLNQLQRLASQAEREGNIVARNALAARLNQLRLARAPEN